jgi:hypothetical protein
LIALENVTHATLGAAVVAVTWRAVPLQHRLGLCSQGLVCRDGSAAQEDNAHGDKRGFHHHLLAERLGQVTTL